MPNGAEALLFVLLFDPIALEPFGRVELLNQFFLDLLSEDGLLDTFGLQGLSLRRKPQSSSDVRRPVFTEVVYPLPPSPGNQCLALEADGFRELSVHAFVFFGLVVAEISVDFFQGISGQSYVLLLRSSLVGLQNFYQNLSSMRAELVDEGIPSLVQFLIDGLEAEL